MKSIQRAIGKALTASLQAEPLKVGYSDWPDWVAWEVAIQKGWFKYLQSDLDEFAFRFKRRKTPLAGFQTLLGIASNKDPVSLRVLSQSASNR